MKVVKVKDYGDLSREAAGIVLEQVKQKPDSVLALPTGSTPVGLYKELVNHYKSKRIDFSKVSIFNLDEYVGLKANDKHSNHRYMSQHLFKHVKIPRKNIHLLKGVAKDLGKECEDFEKKVQKRGIDLLFLGIGVNGHIGFNEPGTSFSTKTHAAELAEETRKRNSRFFEGREVPKKVLTVGIQTIMSAKKIVLLASGGDKAKVINELVNGDISYNIPASVLKTHKDVTIIVDKEAASELKFTVFNEDTLPRNKIILVVSPHPDDSAFSCGGALSMLAKHNKVKTVVMCIGSRAFIPDTTEEQRVEIREKEALEESKILNTEAVFLRLKFYDNNYKLLDEDVNRFFEKLTDIKPDVIFMPSEEDDHPAHRVSVRIADAAIKKWGKEVEIWVYEGPWCVFKRKDFNLIVELTKEAFDNKLKAIFAHKSQINRVRLDRAAKALAELRAVIVPELLTGFGKKVEEFSQYVEVYQQKIVS